MTQVHLCDYGIGNIHNVQRALKYAGAEVVCCTSPAMLDGARAVVLPGVGAFGDCVARFRDMGFEEPVRRLADSGVPTLGICVGMQMLADASEEFGFHQGLGIVPGVVRRLPETTSDDLPLKLPHIAWSRLEAAGEWKGTPLESAAPGTYAYFVHSFGMQCDNAENVLACCTYGGRTITAAVRQGNVFGTQFHPEKSAEPGLRMLRQFLVMASAN